MSYTRDIGREFWFQFDRRFMSPDAAVADAMLRAYVFDASGTPDLDRPVDMFRASFGQPTHPAPFVTAVEPNHQGFIDLARFQVETVVAHLATDDDVRMAFEDFAQGVLLDD